MYIEPKLNKNGIKIQKVKKNVYIKKKNIKIIKKLLKINSANLFKIKFSIK